MCVLIQPYDPRAARGDGGRALGDIEHGRERQKGEQRKLYERQVAQSLHSGLPYILNSNKQMTIPPE